MTQEEWDVIEVALHTAAEEQGFAVEYTDDLAALDMEDERYKRTIVIQNDCMALAIPKDWKDPETVQEAIERFGRCSL